MFQLGLGFRGTEIFEVYLNWACVPPLRALLRSDTDVKGHRDPEQTYGLWSLGQTAPMGFVHYASAFLASCVEIQDQASRSRDSVRVSEPGDMV